MLKPISLLQSKWKIRSWCVSLRANYSRIAFNLVFKEGDSKGEDYSSCHFLNFLIIFFDGTIFLLTMEKRGKNYIVVSLLGYPTIPILEVQRTINGLQMQFSHSSGDLWYGVCLEGCSFNYHGIVITISQSFSTSLPNGVRLLSV